MSEPKTIRDYKRGQLMLGFLKHEVRKSRNFRLLDLGAGEGGINPSGPYPLTGGATPGIPELSP